MVIKNNTNSLIINHDDYDTIQQQIDEYCMNLAKYIGFYYVSKDDINGVSKYDYEDDPLFYMVGNDPIGSFYCVKQSMEHLIEGFIDDESIERLNQFTKIEYVGREPVEQMNQQIIEQVEQSLIPIKGVLEDKYYIDNNKIYKVWTDEQRDSVFHGVDFLRKTVHPVEEDDEVLDEEFDLMKFVKTIEKVDRKVPTEDGFKVMEHIRMTLMNGEVVDTDEFDQGEEYQDLELNVKYTPEELGIFDE